MPDNHQVHTHLSVELVLVQFYTIAGHGSSQLANKGVAALLSPAGPITFASVIIPHDIIAHS